MTNQSTPSTQIYKYKLINNHIIFSIDNKTALLDTGANSIGNEELIFMNQTFNVAKNFLGTSIEQISKYVGTHIDILFGIDIIQNFDLLIDAKSHTLVFSNEALSLDGIHLPLSNDSIISAVVDNEYIKLFFDTGASTSYIHSSFTENKITAGATDDFFPAYGSFKTNLYSIDTQIAQEDIMLKYGVLPKALEAPLLLHDTQGIIGVELLQHFNCLLCFKTNTMILQKYKPKKIVFFTGAGISADSGISTFRDADGLWENYDVQKICTAGCLDTNRDETVEFYNNRRLDLKDKRPNKAHHTIARLQTQYSQSIKIITQNVDDLFEKAGCKDVLHVH
ncbi:MAG: Sir2 family NAD-dependent protein deacetylase, partial [Campylobacterota bacterium]|nr:Sir2 family NAD-dependent protein deacetylase [Campylobacterota bacterium]